MILRGHLDGATDDIKLPDMQGTEFNEVILDSSALERSVGVSELSLRFSRVPYGCTRLLDILAGGLSRVSSSTGLLDGGFSRLFSSATVDPELTWSKFEIAFISTLA